MKLGATSWVFDWAPPYEKAIKSIAELGFKCVELTVWDNNFLKTHYSSGNNKDTRKMIEDLGMECSNLFCLPSGAASREAKERAIAVDEFERCVVAAKELGSKFVTTCAPTPFELDYKVELWRPTYQLWSEEIPEGWDIEQNYNDYIDTLNKYGQVLEAYDMRLCLEPHPGRYMKNADSMLRIIDKLATDRIGMNFDPSHMLPMAQFPEIVAYRVNKRIFNCHFSDNDAQSNAHWRPGKGKISWNAVIRALKDIGFDGAISLELEDVPGAAGFPGHNKDPRGDYEALMKEYKLAKEYIERVCAEEGVVLE